MIRCLCVMLLLSISCSDTVTTSSPTGPVQVVTSIYPLQYFTERIGGEHVVARCDLPQRTESRTWRPTAEQVSDYQRADLVVLNGAGLESWVAGTSLPASRIVDTSRRVELIQRAAGPVHSHGSGDSHSHTEPDPHIWMDPNNALLQAEEIRDALVRLQPELEVEFDTGLESLSRDLLDLDRHWRAWAERSGEVAYVAGPQGMSPGDHPYAYLVRRYNAKITDEVDYDGDPFDCIWVDEWERGRLKAGIRSADVHACEAKEGGRATDYLVVMRRNIEGLEAELP